MGLDSRAGRTAARAAAMLVLALLLLPVASPSGSAGYPVLPAIDGSRAISNISSPVVAPGDAGSVTLQVSDPLPVPIDQVVLNVQVYGFNAYPGNATGPPPPDGLFLGPSSASNATLNISVGTLSVGASEPESIPFSTAASASQGTYAIRTELSFLANGTMYLFESRGWFSASLWAGATVLPDGGSTLNLSRLGVSGVVPETGVLVRSDSYTPWLYALVVGGLVLAAAGAYYATRDGPGSSSGARPPAPESKAPRAFGNRRTRDGD